MWEGCAHNMSPQSLCFDKQKQVSHSLILEVGICFLSHCLKSVNNDVQGPREEEEGSISGHVVLSLKAMASCLVNINCTSSSSVIAMII